MRDFPSNTNKRACITPWGNWGGGTAKHTAFLKPFLPKPICDTDTCGYTRQVLFHSILFHSISPNDEWNEISRLVSVPFLRHWHYCAASAHCQEMMKAHTGSSNKILILSVPSARCLTCLNFQGFVCYLLSVSLPKPRGAGGQPFGPSTRAGALIRLDGQL